MRPSPDKRHLAKLAVMIHTNLNRPRLTWDGELPELTWLQSRNALRRLQLAQRRGWNHAGDVQQRELQENLQRLREELQQRLTQWRRETSPAPLCPHNIYRDLLALHDEFAEVAWSKKRHTLSATTEPITLEGRYLGPFRIELDIRQFHPQPMYRVVAEDPQPSSRDSEVSHPHVQGDRLCEGEGTMPIRAAVREGRLLDSFLIVSNLLHTYNASSPYVTLEEWDGISCRECDYVMDEDDSRHCERCETTLCSECVRYCCECAEAACSSCSRTCPGCDEDVCLSCVKPCRDCGQSFCSSCLQDDERCQSCHEEFQEQADRPAPDTALQSV